MTQSTSSHTVFGCVSGGGGGNLHMGGGRPRSVHSTTRSSPTRKARSNTGSGAASTSAAAVSAAAAANTIQKHWRGNAPASATSRSNDKRVNELKEEVRQLRHEQHIRHLSKELDVTKSALEQERKLRSLQMDAIKVLWKEVQLMDVHQHAGGPRSGPRTIPSGQLGSKISSRSSEHSIAKLMETLEATASATASASHHASTGGGGGHAIVPSNSVSMSLSGMAASTSAGSGGGNGGLHPGHPGDPSIMAQSMPATVMAHQLQDNSAIDALNKTCSNLQSQVESLQTSLSGVMQFMSAFSSFDINQEDIPKRTRRNSSSTTTTTSTTQDTLPSHCTGGGEISGTSSVDSRMGHSITRGQPMSLPLITTHTTSQGLEDNEQAHSAAADPAATPKNEFPATAMAAASGTIPCFHHHPHPHSNTKAAGSGRSRSPRPQTLPGLVTNSNSNKEQHQKIPGLAQLAGTALLNSPQAPQQVKAFAKTLVEGLITDTVAATAMEQESANVEETDNEATDVSFSLAADEDMPTHVTKDAPTDLDPD